MNQKRELTQEEQKNSLISKIGGWIAVGVYPVREEIEKEIKNLNSRVMMKEAVAYVMVMHHRHPLKTKLLEAIFSGIRLSKLIDDGEIALLEENAFS